MPETSSRNLQFVSPAKAVVDPRIADQVRAEQVRTLYRQSAPMVLANVVNALIISVALWSHASHGVLVAWVVAMSLMALGRIALKRLYWSVERAPDEHRTWGVRFCLGSMTAGSLWGFAGYGLMSGTLGQQVLILFVVGGMCAAAAGTNSCYRPAYFAFVLPSLLPAITRLILLGGDEHLAMAGMTVMFLAALTVIARNVHMAFVEAFRLRFENATLLWQVSRAHESVVAANEQLVQANEQLESRVRERTAQLRTSQEQLAEIVNESPDAIMVFDEPGTVISANPAAERLIARPAGLMIGLNFAECVSFSATEADRAYAAFNSALQGDERQPEEFRFERGDGQTVIVEVMLRVVYGRSGERRMHAVIRDVTERHRMQKLKQAYEQRLREAERLESIGLLAGGVAHDFNNVLTMILSNVDLLQTWGDDPNSDALLGEIRHGSQQAASLTKQLLAFSRKQVLDVKPTDLGYIISNARKLFERAAGAQHRLDIRLPAEPMVVLVDATQIEQAIMNLLVNANHATPEGGCIELTVTSMALEIDADWPDADGGEYVRISVTDPGIGMDEATRRRVFEPFFTTKELGHGTGLGLSSVHGVVKQAGGHIRVLSQPGRGSRFEILLPCHAAPAPEIPRHDSAVWNTSTGTVLVVEDQPQVRRALEHLLENAGYHVLAAGSGEDALALVRRLNGRIDLLVSDIIMPGVSGIELSRRLLATYPKLAVLLVSGYAGSEFGALAELGEDVQFLQKPFDAASLSTAMRAALQRAAAREVSQPGTRDAR